MLKRFLIILAACLVPTEAAAQLVTFDALLSNTGNCVTQYGTGAPNGAQIGSPCDVWAQTDSPFTRWLKTSGSASNTGWIPIPSIGGSTTGTVMRWNGTTWEASTLILPNAATANRLVYGTSTNTWGESSNLTFDGSTFTTLAGVFTGLTNSALTAGRVTFAGTAGLLADDADLTFATDTLSATKVAMSSLTSGRIPFSSTLGLQVDDADLTFATDTLTATKVSAPTSTTTPVVYGSGSPVTLGLGGAVGLTGCTTNPPTAGNCEAATHTYASILTEQRLPTTPAYRSRWQVAEDRTILNSYNSTTGLFRPLTLEGLGVQVRKGGLHLGGTGGVADAGEGNAYIEGWMKSVSPVYSLQTSGMSVDFAQASIDTQYLYSNELHVKNFIADLQMALAGSQIITKSVAVVSRDFSVPAGGSISTLYVKDLPSAADMAVFESGDAIRLRQFSRAAGSLTVTDAYGVVTSYADLADGEQSWTFTRSLSPCIGAASTGATITADSLALDYGVSGNGAVETNAIDGVYGINSPYVKVVTRGTCASDQTTQAKFGNLRGDTGVTEYGLLAGAYASGQYIVMSNTRAEIHGVPLSLYSGANRTLYMNPVLASFGQSTSSAETMTYTTGVGCWSGIDAGVFKWRCGDPAGQGVHWNGTTLNVNGNITVTGFVAADTLAVDGVAAADVASGAARGLLGIDVNGNPNLPAVATPSGSGLFLGSDYMGYYASGAWKTYIASNGDFYLGGTGGNLTWVAATSTLTISATLAGNGSAITSISGGNITTGSVTATQIEADTITASQIAADTITASQIAANAITTSELNADSVTSAKIVAGTIVASDIATGTITANEITAGTITGSLIAAGTVTASNIASATITATQIAAGTITATEIASGTITADRISSGTITGDRIAAGTIDGTNIGAGEITADKLDVTTLSAITADLGTVTAGSITGVTMSAGGGAVTIDSEGIDLDSGEDFVNCYKFDGTCGLASHSNFRWLYGGSSGLKLQLGSSGNVEVSGSGSNTFIVSMPSRFSDLIGGGDKIACADNDGNLFYGCAESQLDALRAEITELRSLINTLLGGTSGRDPMLPVAIRKQ